MQVNGDYYCKFKIIMLIHCNGENILSVNKFFYLSINRCENLVCNKFTREKLFEIAAF